MDLYGGRNHKQNHQRRATRPVTRIDSTCRWSLCFHLATCWAVVVFILLLVHPVVSSYRQSEAMLSPLLLLSLCLYFRAPSLFHCCSTHQRSQQLLLNSGSHSVSGAQQGRCWFSLPSMWHVLISFYILFITAVQFRLRQMDWNGQSDSESGGAVAPATE